MPRKGDRDGESDEPTDSCCALMTAPRCRAGSPEPAQPNPYQGTSNPPPDDTITRARGSAQARRPSLLRPIHAAGYSAEHRCAAATRRSPRRWATLSNARSAAEVPTTGSSRWLPTQPHPAPESAGATNDPDGDIVHPAAAGPGEVGEGPPSAFVCLTASLPRKPERRRVSHPRCLRRHAGRPGADSGRRRDRGQGSGRFDAVTPAVTAPCGCVRRR